jgi:hypothetical protein
MLDQLNIKAGIGTVLINAVQQYLTGTQLLTGLYQLVPGRLLRYTDTSSFRNTKLKVYSF